jgi:hypothetical protein
MIIAFSIGYEDHTAYYEVDAALLANLLDVYIELEGSEIEYSEEFEDEEVDFDSINFLEFEEEAEEAEEDDVIYDVDGTAWWFCEDDAIWYYFDENEDDWVVYDEDGEDAAAW